MEELLLYLRLSSVACSRSFGLNLNGQYTFVFITGVYSGMSKQSEDYCKWRPFPAANKSLVNNAWSHINHSTSVYLASPRSFLLFLFSSISHKASLPHYSYPNITPHHPLNPALPSVSQLLLSHVNKWWPSWHDFKLVCFLWDKLRQQKSNISTLLKGTSVHVCTLQTCGARTCASLYTHTHK